MAVANGPALTGYCLDILLYGILTVQVYLYYLAFPCDKRMTKAMVTFVYVVGTVQTIFALHDFYVLFCTPQGEGSFQLGPLAYQDPHLLGFMWLTIPVSSALTAVVAQLFYAHRIYTISRNKLITGVVAVLAILQLACGLTSAVLIYRPEVQDMEGDVVGTYLDAMVWGSAGAICDLVIAIYMFRFLSVQMQRSSRTTQVILTKLNRLLLETGFLTAVMAGAYTVLSVISGVADDLFMIPGLSLGKIYSNCMLVLLNNRFTVPEGRNAPHPEFEIPSYSLARASTE